MRDYCSHCGETFHDENMDSCECGRSLCYCCLQVHLQESGHQRRSECGQQYRSNPVDMRGVFTAEVSQKIFDRMAAEPAVRRYGAITGEDVYSGRIKFQSALLAERSFDFRLDSDDFQRRLLIAAGNQQQAIDTFIDDVIARFIQCAIQWEMETMSDVRRLQIPLLPWQRCEEAEKEVLANAIKPCLADEEISAELVIQVCDLPFYPQGRLLSFQDPSWSNSALVLYLLEITTQSGKPSYYTLNGISAPIHDVNQSAEVEVTQETVLAYLQFFCFFVQGAEGPFYVIAELNDPLLPSTLWDYMPVPKGEGVTLKQFFRPPVITQQGKDGSFHCSCLVMYANSLFIADFIVRPSGMVEMQSDEPILTDLPFHLTIPLTMTDKGTEA